MEESAVRTQLFYEFLELDTKLRVVSSHCIEDGPMYQAVKVALRATEGCMRIFQDPTTIIGLPEATSDSN